MWFHNNNPIFPKYSRFSLLNADNIKENNLRDKYGIRDTKIVSYKKDHY